MQNLLVFGKRFIRLKLVINVEILEEIMSYHTSYKRLALKCEC